MILRVIGRTQNFEENSAALAAIDLGNGIAAALTMSAYTAKSIVNATAASAGSLVLLPANPNRRAALIVNNGTTNLHITVAASPFTGDVASESVVAPGAVWDAQEAYQGVVYGWWEGAPTGAANITEVDDTTTSSSLGTASTPNVSSFVPVGVGTIFAVPTNGTNTVPVALGAPPSGTTSFKFYLGPNQSVAYTFAVSAAAAATAFGAGQFSTASNAASTGGDVQIADAFAGSLNVYVGVVAGAPRARYM